MAVSTERFITRILSTALLAGSGNDTHKETLALQPISVSRTSAPLCTSLDVRGQAIAAVFARYPYLVPLVVAAPPTTIRVDPDGWIVTVWLCASLYKRVAVSWDGLTRLIPADL